MLEPLNFGHMTTSALQLESRDKILLVTSWTEIMTSKPFFWNAFILRRPRLANSADTNKVASMFIKTNFKNFKRIKNYVCTQFLIVYLKPMILCIYLNAIYIYTSWYNKSFWFSVKNTDVSKTQWLCHAIYIFFGSSLGKLGYCKTCETDFREGEFFASTIPLLTTSSTGKAHPE